MVRWLNKPQAADPCIAAFGHAWWVEAVAVSKALLVCGAGKVLNVYGALTRERLLEHEGGSDVKSVAVSDEYLVVGYEDGSLAVWDAGTWCWVPGCERRGVRWSVRWSGEVRCIWGGGRGGREVAGMCSGIGCMSSCWLAVCSV